MGTLRIRSKIDLAQFWPKGESDADTTKIVVSVDGAGAFTYAADGRTYKSTRAFDGACVRGTQKGPVIDKKQRIRGRLQGIDALELHFRAPPSKKADAPPDGALRKDYNEQNGEFRQPVAESATVALLGRLATINSQEICCEFYSHVDEPREVIVIYGRFVGNIWVGKGFSGDSPEHQDRAFQPAAGQNVFWQQGCHLAGFPL